MKCINGNNKCTLDPRKKTLDANELVAKLKIYYTALIGFPLS